MKVSKLIANYLADQHMMQLATESDGQPWVCTVYYVVDEKLNLYWLSLPNRRHSKELVKRNKVAAAIPIKFTKGKKVVGIQLQGHAEQLPSDNSSRQYVEVYATKFNRTEDWVNNFCNDKTEHKLYKLIPTLFVLFDENNFPIETRQEYKIK